VFYDWKIKKMTKKILSTSIKEIDGIKIRCNKCNAAWIIPFSKEAGTQPSECISCHNKISHKAILELTDTIIELKKDCDKFNFDIIIETEED